jgi:hypothetical protein
MKRTFLITLLMIVCSSFAWGQIPGCTSDVRSGVCNEKCSVAHVAGCTLEQFKPLVLIRSTDCLSAAVDWNDSEKSARNSKQCMAESDRLREEWKSTHTGKIATKKVDAKACSAASDAVSNEYVNSDAWVAARAKEKKICGVNK